MKDTLQTGMLEIVKTMDGKKNGELDGIQFRVTGTAANGQKYDKTFSTDVPAAPKTGQNPVVPVIAAFVMACAASAGVFEIYRSRRKKSQNR